MVRSFLALLFLSFGLQAQTDPMHANSGEANYDGRRIELVGNVVLQHSLGQISANRLAYSPAKDLEKKNKNSSLEISGCVEILLKGGGLLQCQKADVDYVKMKGIFNGNAEFPDVVYCNEGEESSPSEKKRAYLEVKSHQMTLNLLKEKGVDASSAKTLVNTIEAEQNVRVGYDNDHILVADHAFYQRLSDTESSALAGLLTLSVRGGHPFCDLTNENGDCLQAKTIQINTVERKLWLAEPEGKLLVPKAESPSQTLEFKAEELVWDHQNQMMLLKEDVEIILNKSLQVQTQYEISIAQVNVNGKRALRFIHSPKETTLTYLEDRNGNLHCIICPGPLTIDHELQQITLHKGDEEASEPEKSFQVHIEDVRAEMYADHVIMHYQWENGHFIPGKIVLEGHVQLLNRFDGHIEESGSVLHYTLADRIDYSPQQHEMILSAAEGNRVLFFDKVNNIQMSAPSLKIQRDPSTQKEIIKGIGDVRFTFLEKELAQFKKHFKQKELFEEGADRDK